ncbi:MAG: hypothetical protein CVU38_17260 [Chloroflexi bacterium HGW-Chloroflexi-1]|nr:MAG: hypothetical protein CVU38_17260 [Chloroflexi bacterium HGW-Chloroflexi-1]
MGVIYAGLRLKNRLKNENVIEADAKVDTGATLLVIPEAIARELELPVIRKQTVKYVNEETAEREVVWGLEVELCGRKGVFEAIVEPKKRYVLIGAVVLESLDLIVEPRSLGLYANPRSQLPMAEIE